jgi:cystathionine beta-lyase
MWLDCRELGLKNKNLTTFLPAKRRRPGPGWWFGENGTGFMRMNIACPCATLQQGLGQNRPKPTGFRAFK